MKSTTQINTVINLWINNSFKNIMNGRKRSLNIVGPRQSQRPPVYPFFIIHIDFIKHNTYRFYIMKTRKNIIYDAHTGVDPGMSSIGDAS